jgi:hypothetical protein
MKRKHDAATTGSDPEETQEDQHAYEDSWYRSLKAMAEGRPDADEEEEEPADA